MRLKIPILQSPSRTLSRWAAELRSKYFVSEDDFQFFDYDPNPSVNPPTAMTLTVTDTTFCKYLKVGSLVLINMRVAFTLGGVASSELLFATPPQFQSDGFGTFSVAAVDGGGTISGAGSMGNDGLIRVTRYDGANWGIGANRIVRIFGGYIINS